MEQTKEIGKKRLLFILIAFLLGVVVGFMIWAFFKAMELGIHFFWEFFPSIFAFDYYPILVCTIGGVLIGICQKKFGTYPEELSEVMDKVKETHRYEYNKMHGIAICALLPLVFGGSIGPEAGLTGVVAGLCTWVGDRFKNVAKEMKEITNIGMSAALSAIFHSPFFGFLAPIENEDEGIAIPHKAKMILNFAAIFGGLGSYFLLTQFFGGGMGLGHFDKMSIEVNELLWLIPFALLGTLAGYLYYIFEKLSKFAFGKIERFTILRTTIGGLLLGVCGVFFPLTMFSGEAEMTDLMNSWHLMSAATLFLTAVLKIVIINVCIQSGWRGGNIFPIIFSGICLGYAMSIFTGVDSVFAVAIVTAALCGAVMRKPLAVTMLLLLCFPARGIISMSVAAFIGANIPMPALLKGAEK